MKTIVGVVIGIVLVIVIFLAVGWFYYGRPPAAPMTQQLNQLSGGLYNPISTSSVATSTTENTPRNCGVISAPLGDGPTAAAVSEDAVSVQNSVCVAEALVGCSPMSVSLHDVEGDGSYIYSDYVVLGANADGTCNVKSRTSSSSESFGSAVFQPVSCTALPVAVYNNSYLENEPTYGVLNFFTTLDAIRQSIHINDSPSSIAGKYGCVISTW